MLGDIISGVSQGRLDCADRLTEPRDDRESERASDRETETERVRERVKEGMRVR